ncbi:hypothetical protein DAPPUDRAFT_312322 [Daphnia pulex]|uniref:Peptidase C1A papain C-terminal domain-containing protein n=1 Tax=Daphnia pulex TaxID=6669 RepID=E9G0G6_DAPPU|nr:hypothetical protein DAPPUDRAFT_312322 [Daphnia pulex]|eukprot:EFX87407.1 hypothetical protein DAPPUDRAFT_312322 [Daphnia pulex]
MNFLFALMVCAVVVTVVQGQSKEEAWRVYKRKFNKNYQIPADDGKRDRMRKEAFSKSYDRVQKHNSNRMSHYRRKLNRFSDMLPGQLKQFLGINNNSIPTAPPKMSIHPLGMDIITQQNTPSRLDLRYDSCLPEIKNQGQCGSCWAITAVTSVEFAYCKKNNNNSVLLSEQQVLDCDRTDMSIGCRGGWPWDAWEYMSTNGIARTSVYPYKGVDSVCKYVDSMKVTSVRAYNYVESRNVADMQYALTNFGPLVAAMTVVQSFMDYASGVYDDKICDGKLVNHAVVLVGWGNQNGIDYWIGRNSWGPGWGKEGYFLIQRGVNKCQIETYVGYALV